jgi:hypothetical protein
VAADWVYWLDFELRAGGERSVPFLDWGFGAKGTLGSSSVVCLLTGSMFCGMIVWSPGVATSVRPIFDDGSSTDRDLLLMFRMTQGGWNVMYYHRFVGARSAKTQR